MEQQIKSTEELINWFFEISKTNQIITTIHKGIYVTTEVRRNIMCSDRQGKITINGQVERIVFTNLSGGVYHACIEK